MPKSKDNLESLSTLDLRYCNPPCLLSDLDDKLVADLVLAQKMCQTSFLVTSGFRSVEHEKSKGRKGTSSHCKGLAVDVSARDSLTRFKVVVSAALAGIPRIGVGKTFVHLDIDMSKPHPILFHYYEPQET